MLRLTTMISLALALLGAPAPARALDILLTNDDGYLNVGITTLRAALCAAGHHVTMVAPATNQSGRGGSLNTGSLSSSSAMALTRQSTDACGVVYSLAAPTVPGTYGGTPVDSVKAGLDVILVNDPPDLVVSGLNFAANMGKGAPSSSGTVGAALAGALAGIPAIAGSIALDLTESPTFPSTFGAYVPAAAFTVRLVAALEALPGNALLPQGVRMLNVNFPVPYSSIQGVKLTTLGETNDLAIPLFDRNLGYPPIPPNPGFTNCLSLADGQSCSLMVGLGDSPGPDPDRNVEVDALRAGFIAVTPMDADMTTKGAGNALLPLINGLTP